MSGPRTEDGRVAAVVEDEAHDIEADGDDGASADPDAGDDLEGSSETGEDGEDHGGEDAVGSDEGATQRPAEVGQSRGSRRIQSLIAERNAERDRARRLEEALLQRPQTGNNGPDLAAQAAKRRQDEMAEAEERARLGDYGAVAKVTERHLREDYDQRFQGLQFQMGESADRMSFENLCARNPAVGAMRDEIEQRLAQERRAGLNFPRETVAKFLLGERALKNAGRAKTVQQKRADGAIRRETVAAPRGTQRSDVARSSGRSSNDAAARKARLENQSI